MTLREIEVNLYCYCKKDETGNMPCNMDKTDQLGTLYPSLNKFDCENKQNWHFWRRLTLISLSTRSYDSIKVILKGKDQFKFQFFELVAQKNMN